MTQINHIVTPESKTINYLAFDCRDDLDRVVGAMIVTADCEIKEGDGPNKTIWPVGKCYFVKVQVTRNAVTWGANQMARYFLLKADADRYVQKRVRDIQERYNRTMTGKRKVKS